MGGQASSFDLTPESISRGDGSNRGIGWVRQATGEAERKNGGNGGIGGLGEAKMALWRGKNWEAKLVVSVLI
jgi:hypothetical protein